MQTPEELVVGTDRIVLVRTRPGPELSPQQQAELEFRVNRQDQIARVTGGRGHMGRITTQTVLVEMDVVEVIKGSATPEVVYMAGVGPGSDAMAHRDVHFDLHADTAFWADPLAGRGVLSASCGFQWAFAPEQTYLVFVGARHVKAAELISGEDDGWLAFVRDSVASRDAVDE